MQLRLEEENHALMIQLQALMNQNQDLLTKILNSKDHFAEEQKSYLLVNASYNLMNHNKFTHCHNVISTINQ